MVVDGVRWVLPLIVVSVALQVIGANNPEVAPLVWVGAGGFFWAGWMMRGGN